MHSAPRLEGIGLLALTFLSAGLAPGMEPRIQRAYERAIKAEAAEAVDEAIELFSLAIKDNPNSSSAYRHRGSLYARKGMLKEAAADLEIALARSEHDGESWKLLGDARLGLKLYGPSAEAYQKAIENKLETSEIYRNLAEAYAGAGMPAKALDAYSRAIRLRSDAPETYLKRGLLLAGMGQARDAMEDYERAIHLNPNYAEALFERANYYWQAGEPERAVADISKALEAKPGADWPLRERSLRLRVAANQKLEKSEDVLADYGKIIELNPKNASAWQTRGSAYLVSGRFKEALADLEQASQLAPGNLALRDAVEKTRTVLTAKESPAPPTEPVKPIVGPPVAPVAPPALAADTRKRAQELESYGRKLIQEGNFGKAALELGAALALNPDSATCWNARGFAYLRLRDFDKAITDFERALKLNPDYENAKANLAAARKARSK